MGSIMFGIDDAIIGGGLSIIGSLFGGDDEETTTTVDYKKMVENAEGAGFNPLTAIRNGGSAGFTTTHHPGLSSSALIGSAIGKVGNMISSYDPTAKATAALETKIKEETLRNLQADTAQRLKASIGGVPVTSGQRSGKVASGVLALLPKPGQPFGPEVPAMPKQDEMVNPFPTGSGIEVPGWIKSGDAWESFMGDLGTVPATAINVGATLYHNFRKYRPDVDKMLRDIKNRPRPPANIGIKDAMMGQW